MRRVCFATAHLNCTMSWHLSVSLVCVRSVSRGMTSSPAVQTRSALCRHSNTGRVVPLLAAWGHLLTRSLLLLLLCICLCLLWQWSDWLSCGCLSVCRISLLSRVLYSACLLLALSPNSCRSLRSLNSSPQQITGFLAVAVSLFWCCLMLQILTSWVFIALCGSLVYWFHPRWTCCLSVSAKNARLWKRALNGILQNAVNAEGHLKVQTALSVFLLSGAVSFSVLCVFLCTHCVIRPV